MDSLFLCLDKLSGCLNYQSRYLPDPEYLDRTYRYLVCMSRCRDCRAAYLDYLFRYLVSSRGCLDGLSARLDGLFSSVDCLSDHLSGFSSHGQTVSDSICTVWLPGVYIYSVRPCVDYIPDKLDHLAAGFLVH